MYTASSFEATCSEASNKTSVPASLSYDGYFEIDLRGGCRCNVDFQ
jgi:hypothetical protein